MSPPRHDPSAPRLGGTGSGEGEPMSERVFNFSAGPAVMPDVVIERSQAALWDLDGTGIGVMEHSHRGKAFMKVYDRAVALTRELAGIGDDHEVLFLQGGASSQFYMVPMNLLAAGETADYFATGEFARKAIVEAERFGRVHVAATSEDERFGYIPPPASHRWSERPVYAHYTSNNTIFGTEWTAPPAPPSGVALVCDASSDIFSRPIEAAKHGLIYAGAQKNLGPSGLTLVIIRKDVVERGKKELPPMLQYRTHAANQSMYNTPPTFGIYVLSEMLAWIKAEGGLAAMAERNRAKAAVLYDHLDRATYFRGTARKDSRSLMNVCFRAPSEALEAKFCAEAERRGLAGLKGHRSVGGMRASIYNAFPKAGCEALVAFMKEFEAQNPPG
jgi:phosphoserine aminotransferase